MENVFVAFFLNYGNSLIIVNVYSQAYISFRFFSKFLSIEIQ